MAMIKWIITSAAAFAALETKNNNALYFLQDTQEIYRGAVSFTQSLTMVDSFPASGAQGRVYMDKITLEGKVWNGSAWTTVIQPIATVLEDGTTENKAVSGEAIKTYVTSKVTEAVDGKFVEGITFNKSTKDLEYVKDGATVAVPIDGFVTGATYEGSTGTLKFAVEGGQEISISLPKDNFVESGAYDAESKEIILTLVDGSKVTIPAADLVDVNEFGSSSTVETVVNGEGLVTSSVKISATANNLLKANADGLYAEATDISGKLDKVATAKADELVVAKADGQVQVSGIKVGTGTLSETPNDKTLATEAAISAIKATLEASIATKFDKSSISTTLVDAATASDTKVVSEKVVVDALDALAGKTVAKTDITNVIDAATPSTSKVTSEKAIVDALSWTVLN